MKYLLIVAISFINLSLSHGQEADSVLHYYQSQSKKYLFTNSDSAKMYLGKYAAKSRLFNQKEHEMMSCKLLGIWYDIQSSYDSSFQQYQRALLIAQELRDRKSFADVSSNIGLLENKRGNYEAAISQLTIAAKLYDSLNLVEYGGRVRVNIIWTYAALELYDNALRVVHQAVQLFEKTQNRKHLAATYANWAIILTRQDKLDSAILMHKEAARIQEEVGDLRGLASTKNNLGSISLKVGRIEEAIEFLEGSIKLKKEIGDIPGTFRPLKNLAEAYKERAEYTKALASLENAYKEIRLLEEPQLLAEYYFEFSSIYEGMGQYDRALDYYRKHVQLNDSLKNESVSKAVAEIETKYESDRKDQEILLLAKTNEAQLNERNIILVVALGLFLLGATIYHYYRQGRKKNRLLNEQKLVIEESLAEREVLLREIHHRVKNNLQIVSSLLNIQSKLLKDPSAKSAVQTGRDRVQSMALTHKLLYQNQSLSNLSLREYISQLSDSLVDTYGAYGNMVLQKEIDEVLIDLDSAVNLGLLINELISNAMKHAFDDFDSAVISIKLKQNADQVELTVADNGRGMQKEGTKTDSYGMRLIKSLSDALRGTLSIESVNGTKVKLVMPAL